MPDRELVNPHFSVDLGDEDYTVRLRFNVLGSKHGPVTVILIDSDAEALYDELASALDALDARPDAELLRVARTGETQA